MSDLHDVVVLGAGETDRTTQNILLQAPANQGYGLGLYGIACARSYLGIHPDANLVILEAERVVGGTWSTGG